VHVSVGTVELDVSLVHVNDVIRCDGFVVEVLANENDTKTIVVSAEPEEKKPPRSFAFALLIQRLTIAFVDKSLREIALCSLDRLEVSFVSSEVVGFAVRLRSFQFDDLHPHALLQVAAAGNLPLEPGQFLAFDCQMVQNTPLFTTCKSVSFALRPIVVFADLAFISDLLFFFEQMFASKSVDLLEAPKPAKPSRAAQRPFTAESLEIGETTITIFTRSGSERTALYPETVRFLNLIPDITNATISLPALSFTDCTMTRAYVRSEILKPLLQALQTEALKVLLRIDLFRPSTGTRSGNFARRVQRLKDGEITVLGRMGGSALLQGGESVLGGVSKVLHAVAFDRGQEVARVNVTAKETAKGGAAAVGRGFLRGITGVVMDPINMARERGAAGAFIGLGKGLIGLVTKPVCGILDGGAGAMAALRKLVNGEDADVIPPMRIARAFPRGEITVLLPDEGGNRVAGSVRFVDSAQFAIRMSGERRWKNSIELFHRDQPGKGNVWFAFAQKKLFVLDPEAKITKTVKIREILRVRVEGARVVISTRRAVAAEFIVLDEAEATQVQDWVITRAQLLLAEC
jgi:vacuolar protein sorting-associated protein 13A/C